jgi:hypothetical protein
LAVPGVVASDVNCTSKTMPGFASIWTNMVHGEGTD